MRYLAALITLLPLQAMASWQADTQGGHEDAQGMVLFFFAFLAFIIVRDGFKESRGKGYLCLAACLFVAWLIATFKWALAIACLVFLAGFLQFCWEKLK